MRNNAFANGSTPAPWWQDSPELGVGGSMYDMGESGAPRGLGQATTYATVWQGPYPLILGPGSWGFGIGPFGGTAVVEQTNPWPTHVRAIH